jgi:DNA-binding CsgD family transcriptional regulator
VLWGACDALFTPRPLGPLHDIAAQVQGDLLAQLTAGADRARLFSAVLAELQSRPVVVVIEDLHWADEATLDLVKYLGRRIARTRALLIFTYRDDELSLQHPLRTVLGDLLTAGATQRLALAPLSMEAVRELAGERFADLAGLHRQTGGNPFFITEVIASGELRGGIPPTVRDAVLARAARLSPSARAVLEAAAIVGARVEQRLLADVTGAEVSAVDQCLATGMLLPLGGGEGLAFRHELARQTILDAIGPHRRLVLHRLVLAALKASPATRDDLARLAHHAQAADDPEAVLEFAPAAARQASAAGAHRAAATLYALALGVASALPAGERARLLEAHAWECQLTGRQAEAVLSRRQALALWQAAGQPLRQGENLAHLATLLVGAEQWAEAKQASRAALEVLGALPPGRELALAYRTQAMLYRYDYDNADAIALAEKAIPLAEAAGDRRTLAMAYDTLGSTWLSLDYERGRAYLDRCLIIAREAGLEARVASVYANLGANSCELYRFEQAARYLAEGVAFTTERDLDLIRQYLLAWQARALLQLGRWGEASAVVAEALERPGVPANNRIPALVAAGLLRARRGDPGVEAVLDEALALTERADNFQNQGQVRPVRAEAGWLAGDPQRALAEARAIYDLALSKRHPWIAGALAFWRWRAGDAPGPLPEWVAAPFALQIAGDWRAAAEAWRGLGCPYEQASALADGDPPAQLEALSILEGLGAAPAAELLRQKLLAAGLRLSRGPRAATRENPFGLTARQLDILGLLAQDLTNAEIAARLHLSPKTVDHHVSAVLAKLDVHSREKAAELARQHPDLGLSA